MNKIKCISLTLLLLCGIHLSAQNADATKLQTIDGKTIIPTEWIDGKTPFVVSFWFATCKYCFEEMDTISELYEEWNKEVPFRFIGVCTDDTRGLAKAKAKCQSRGYDNFSFYFDVNKEYMRAMKVVTMPHLFLFDKEGNIVYTHTGYAPGNEMELFDELCKLK